MKKGNFKQLLELCTLDSNFIFNQKYYSQYEGFAMGSPLSAPMANIFLCHHESKWLTECPHEYKPLLYKRYVDDTFLVFRDPGHIQPFLNYLNSRHPNISFTVEYESNNSLNFLDITVTKKDNDTGFMFIFNVFRIDITR